MVEFEVVKTNGKSLGKIVVPESTTVKELKVRIASRWNISIDRQSIRPGPRGKSLDDNVKLTDCQLENPGKIYVKDLGPQIGWNTVFYFEYAGPLFIYLLTILLANCLYGQTIANQKGDENYYLFLADYTPLKGLNSLCNSELNYKISSTVFWAAIFWTFHYGKRIFETAFIHRFSHGTMPIFNLFKNCSYYWGFALYIAYHVNHPLHTPPSPFLFYLGSLIFIVCEIGNLSIHLLLRNLRPEGTNVRKIPVPNSNLLTSLLNYVSCPNYTYEFGSWIGFFLLTGCLPVLIFALAGLYQMSVWAIGKHKRYLKEFKDYPKRRKAILPFIL